MVLVDEQDDTNTIVHTQLLMIHYIQLQCEQDEMYELEIDETVYSGL